MNGKICQKCGYVMDGFEKECLRCKGKVIAPVATQNTAANNVVTQQPVLNNPSKGKPKYVVAGFLCLIIFIFGCGISLWNGGFIKFLPSEAPAQTTPRAITPVTPPPAKTANTPEVTQVPEKDTDKDGKTEEQDDPPSEPKRKVVTLTTRQFVSAMGDKVLNAPNVEDLEDTRSIIAGLYLRYSGEQDDLNQQGYFIEASAGAGSMKQAMGELLDASDFKMSALRNQTGMSNVYTQAVWGHVQAAISIAGFAGGTVKITAPD
jgi:hypothetical protein